MSDKPNNKHVKILVHTPSVDGYPPEEWEGLWALPMEGERFRIDNIPFYAKNLSCDDIVEASWDGDNYVFVKVVDPSENSTIRVLIYDLTRENTTRRDITGLGCSIEGTGTAGLMAVNVPKSRLEEVLNFLEGAFAEERLDFEEGVLR